MSGGLSTVAFPTTPAINYNPFRHESIGDNHKVRKSYLHETRAEFVQRLNQIRKRCEVSYHRTLLDYFPEKRESATSKIDPHRGVWYTDSHFGCRRSDGTALMYSLHRVLERLSFSVSVGDEHDFGHSVLKDPIGAAIEHKKKLAVRYPHCKQYTIAGNHDGAEEYIDGLVQAGKEHSNIVADRYAIKVGKHLFTHGDCVHWENPTVKELEKYRASYNNGWKPNLAERIFDRTTQVLGLHCHVPKYVIELLIPREVQAERLLSFIRHLDPSLLKGVETICFGHTHKAFRNFQYKGFKFTNGGAHETGFNQDLHIFSIKPTAVS